jgi:hypothetical protein
MLYTASPISSPPLLPTTPIHTRNHILEHVTEAMIILVLDVSQKQPIRCLFHLLNHKVQNLSTEIWYRVKYDSEFRPPDLVRL